MDDPFMADINDDEGLVAETVETTNVDADDGEEDIFLSAPSDDAGSNEVVEQASAEVEAPVTEKVNARKEFNLRFREVIEERDAKERELRNERQDKARRELQEWEERREAKTESTKESNRQAEQEQLDSREQDKESVNSWAHVVELIDTQVKSEEGATDVQRMRSVLIQLKNNPIKSAE